MFFIFIYCCIALDLKRFCDKITDMKRVFSKKIIKVALINVLILILIFFIIDYLFFMVSAWESNHFLEQSKIKKVEFRYCLVREKFPKFYLYIKQNLFSKSYNTVSPKNQ